MGVVLYGPALALNQGRHVLHYRTLIVPGDSLKCSFLLKSEVYPIIAIIIITLLKVLQHGGAP